MNKVTNRITKLRNTMLNASVSACVIPSSDPHMSEYVPDYWKARTYFSGFTGSAGTLVITITEAFLWTDSRYFLQAEKELQGTQIKLFKSGEIGVPSYLEFLLSKLAAGEVISMHASVFSTEEILISKTAFSKKHLLLKTDLDLVSKVWTKNRPLLPEKSIFIYDTLFTGKTIGQKIHSIQSILKKKKADVLLLNTLDEIAWLLNLRGNDIKYNPLFIAYVSIENDKVILFVDTKKISKQVNDYLNDNHLILKEYNSFSQHISLLKNKTIWIDKAKMNYACYNQVNNYNRIVFGTSPVAKIKSLKNKIEIEGFRTAMIKDGVALTKFYKWLENCLKSNYVVTEISAAKKLKKFRSYQSLFFEESFAPIIGYNEHGAIVHYSANKQTDVEIKPNGFLLIDSGGHYLNGTTDITRTISLGPLTATQKSDFTLVLKAHIALAKAIFPKGAYGFELDKIAREPLLKNGLNYGHGTGHGVGHFLCVHEGPQSIRPDKNKTPLKKGMVVSNEPGIYRTKAYGIRTENLLLVKELEEPSKNGILHFEILTLFPIDKSAIDFNLLEEKEIKWLNNYHQTVYTKLAPFLSKTEKCWLADKCKNHY